MDVRCPSCLGELRASNGCVVCMDCEAEYKTCEGIPLLSRDASFYYRFAGLERGEMQQFCRDIDHDGFSVAVQRFLRQCDAPRAAAFYRNVFRAERAAWKLTMSFPDHARALDLGAGAGVVSMALSPHCESVVACDLTLERLEFLKRWAEHENVGNMSYACCGDTAQLPFVTDQFDVIDLNGVLEWIPTGRAGNPRTCQKEFLDEIRRILKPSGQMYIGIENRVGYPYFFGKPEDHTGIRFLSLMPRLVARAVHRLKRSSEYRVYTYTAHGLTDLLNSAGFDKVTLYSPFPDYRDFEELIPLDGVCRVTPPRRRSHMKSLLHQVACHPKVFHHLSPSFATVAGHTGTGTTLLMEVAEALQLETESPAPGGFRVSPTGMAVWRARHRDGTPTIVRLAISSEGRTRCDSNFEALKTVQGHPGISDRTRGRIPIPLRRVEIKGQLATAETLLSGRPLELHSGSIDEVWSDLVEMIEDIGSIQTQQNSAVKSFADTVKEWTSAIQCHLCGDTEGRRQAELIGELGAWLASQAIEPAFVHGNCHVGNVLVDDGSNRLSGLFDWDLAARGQPPLIDLLEFAVATQSKDVEDFETFMAPIVPNCHRTLERLAHLHSLPSDYPQMLEIAFLLRLAARHVRLTFVGPDQLQEMQRIVYLIERHSSIQDFLEVSGRLLP